MAHPAPSRVHQIGRTVRILVAEDHPTIRRLVTTTLQAHPHFEVCAEVRDGSEAVREAQKLKPDVIILNITMPVKNGFQAAREIRASLPETAIVILSTNADKRFIEEARKIGARAYVAKTRATEELVNAVECAFLGSDFRVIE